MDKGIEERATLHWKEALVATRHWKEALVATRHSKEANVATYHIKEALLATHPTQCCNLSQQKTIQPAKNFISRQQSLARSEIDHGAASAWSCFACVWEDLWLVYRVISLSNLLQSAERTRA